MLSQRLMAIAAMIAPGAVVADIGTDHALLPVHLIRSGRVGKVYATDNKKGPLTQAERSIAQAGFTDQIIPLLFEGLSGIPADVDTIVISGMGVTTIINILAAAELSRYRRIIVQPNNKVQLLRSWLAERHFPIISEQLIKEYKYYQIIEFSPCGHQDYDQRQIYFGPCLLAERSELFVHYHYDHYLRLRKLYTEHPQKPVDEEYRLLKAYFTEYHR